MKFIEKPLYIKKGLGLLILSFLLLPGFLSAQQILFVVGDTLLDPGDNIIVEALQNEPGVTLEILDDDLATASHATGKDLVLISSTTSAGKLGTTFTNVSTIVSTMNYELLDELGMTDPGGADSFFGNEVKISDPSAPWWMKLVPIQITNNNHPLSFASTNGNATIHSHVPGNPFQALSFTYPSGVQLCNGQTAPADRVGLFLQDAYPTLTDLTPAGETMLQASFNLTQPLQISVPNNFLKLIAPADTGLLRSGVGFQRSNGDYAVIGAGMSTDTIDNNFLYIELNDAGNQTGAYHFQTPDLKEAVDTEFNVHNFTFASNGDIVYATQGRSVVDNGFAPNLRPALIRMDESRNIKFIIENTIAYPRTPLALEATSDNGVILVSYTSASVLVQKFDALGDTVWNSNIQQSKFPKDLYVHSNGDIYILLNDPASEKSYLMTLDSQGDWVGEYELQTSGMADFDLYVMDGLADGNILISGRGKVGGKFMMPILHVSPQGQILGKRLISPNGYGNIRGHAIATHPDGGFAIAGGIIDHSRNSLERPFLARFQSDLDLEGLQVYEAHANLSNKHVAATDVSLTDDWGYLITASQRERVYYKPSFGDLVHTGNGFPLLIKVDAEGLLRTPLDCKQVALDPAADIAVHLMSSSPSSLGDVSSSVVSYPQSPITSGASVSNTSLSYTELSLSTQTIGATACPTELPPCPTVSLQLISPSNNQNYVATYTPRVPVVVPTGSSGKSELQNLEYASELIQKVSYFDGLGRPIQEVLTQGASDAADIISFMKYDAEGRENKAYMAYESHNTYGTFQSSPETDQQNFYSAKFPSYGTNRLFTETQFEPSPLNRPLETASQGDPWEVKSATPGLREANEHTVIQGYEKNDVAILGWGINPNVQSGASAIYYPVGSLNKVKTIDENDGDSFQYTDKLGRTILSKVQISGSSYAITQYIYDEFGRMLYVLQPEGYEAVLANSNTLDQTILDSWAFQYEYDDRGRIARKRVPGAGWTNYAYNQLDQQVLSQNANQALINEWVYTKYDALGRIIETGLYTSANTKNSLEGSIESLPLFEIRQSNADGYSNQAFPTGSRTKLSFTYYDDYDFNSDGTEDHFFLNGTPNERVKGVVTGVKTKVLDSTTWLLTLTFYDEYGRETETRAEHLHGTDIIQNELNYIGEVEKTISIHTGPNSTSIVQTRENCYDHNGRMLRTTSQVNNDIPFVLAEYDYDVLGRMQTKNLHSKDGINYLQSVDYAYNVRSWMTGINSIPTLDDIFEMKLFYNEGFTDGNHNGAASFNGNIAGMIWKTALDSETHGYSFNYDKLNRLETSKYVANSGSWSHNTDRYNVDLSYDKNGNIATLTRYGRDSNTSFGLMDDLDYSYKSGSGNQLAYVDDNAPSNADVEQFIDGNTSGDDYIYDANGNVIEDKNKGISIVYNFFNKPTVITKGSQTITYVYDAAGIKLQQIVNDGSTKTTDYINGVHYEDNVIQFFQHGEGRLVPDGSIAEYRYEYHLKDHLGNTRLTFTDFDDNGLIQTSTEIVQTDHYYPFGMRMSLDPATPSANPNNKYLYNGKELQTDLDLDWYDYGARMYDASIGRWNGVDALADQAPNWTPYRYSLNNPIRFIDPNGLWEFSTTQNDEGRKTLQLQKSNDGDNLESFITESGLSKRQIRNKLFGGGKAGKAAMAAFFGGNESSINVSEFSGNIGRMLQSMEIALNEGNDALKKAGDKAFAPGSNNCFNSTRNLTSDGQYDSRPLTEPDISTISTTMTLGTNFDRELGSQYGNTPNPQTGDAIRYSNTEGAVASHAAVFLLESNNEIQVFTKNGIENKALFQLSTSAKLEEIYGPATGRQNYQATRTNTVKNPDGTTTTNTETYTKSDRSPYYRKN